MPLLELKIVLPIYGHPGGLWYDQTAWLLGCFINSDKFDYHLGNYIVYTAEVRHLKIAVGASKMYSRGGRL